MSRKDEILEMANWCLNCPTKPCSLKGCPINTDIPEFINQIKYDNIKEAYDILIKNNLFSSICSIVCPQEKQCEGSCIRGINSHPTQIGELERYVNEWALDKDYIPDIDMDEPNGKTVAIIGSGPASLEFAYLVAKKGFKVTIFEKEARAGGVLYYGVPEFRLDKNLIYGIIALLAEMQIRFEFNKELGKDIHIDTLRKDYDYVFIGIGLGKSTSFDLTNEDLKEKCIYESGEFLKAYNFKNYIDLGTVAVIGGGNVAMDVARSAIHMGAKKVKILYRRNRNYMPASQKELEDAIEDGVEFMENVNVLSANVRGGKVVSLNCIKTDIIDGKAIDIDGTDFKESVTDVVFAIGNKTDSVLIQSEGIEVNEKGKIIVDDNFKTNLDNVYAAGDVVVDRETVCGAVASGKKAALSLIKRVDGELANE